MYWSPASAIIGPKRVCRVLMSESGMAAVKAHSAVALNAKTETPAGSGGRPET